MLKKGILRHKKRSDSFTKKDSHLVGRILPHPIMKVLEKFFQLLYKRTILVLAILLCAGVAGALWNMSNLSSNLIESQALQNASLYAQALNEARTLYSQEAVNRLELIHGISITNEYESKKGSIPVPATFLIELSKRLSEQNPGMAVRLYSEYPFPNRRAEGGAKDDFEREALRHLKQHPDKPFVRLEKFQGRQALRYAQADILQPSCVNCHNTRLDSPKKDWKVGDVRGVLEITNPLDSFMAETQSTLRGTSLMLALLSILGVSGIAIVIGRLKQTAKQLELRVIERTAELQESNTQLAIEQEKSERLLLNILPEPIAIRLKEGHSNIAEAFAEATILFADLVNFTQLSGQVTPSELVFLLNEIFSGFDSLSEKHNLEKIKTIGDAYMVVGGLPSPRPDHAEAIAEMALDMQQEIMRFNAKYNQSLSIRIGINTGPVVAGVIGTKKFIYDLWGDTVNIASRMESHGLAGEIQVTATTYEHLASKYAFQPRGVIPVKGKGEMVTYLLIGKKELGAIASEKIT